MPEGGSRELGTPLAQVNSGGNSQSWQLKTIEIKKFGSFIGCRRGAAAGRRRPRVESTAAVPGPPAGSGPEPMFLTSYRIGGGPRFRRSAGSHRGLGQPTQTPNAAGPPPPQAHVDRVRAASFQVGDPRPRPASSCGSGCRRTPPSQSASKAAIIHLQVGPWPRPAPGQQLPSQSASKAAMMQVQVGPWARRCRGPRGRARACVSRAGAPAVG